MRHLHLALPLAVFVPGWILLGGLSGVETGAPLWGDLLVGAALGGLAGLCFGEIKAGWLDYLYGRAAPRDAEAGEAGA